MLSPKASCSACQGQTRPVPPFICSDLQPVELLDPGEDDVLRDCSIPSLPERWGGQKCFQLNSDRSDGAAATSGALSGLDPLVLAWFASGVCTTWLLRALACPLFSSQHLALGIVLLGFNTTCTCEDTGGEWCSIGSISLPQRKLLFPFPGTDANFRK